MKTENKLEKIIRKAYEGGVFGEQTHLSEIEIKVQDDEVMLCLNNKCMKFSLYKMLMLSSFWQALGKNCGWGIIEIKPFEAQIEEWKANSLQFHEKNLFDKFDEAVDWLYIISKC